MKNRMCNVCHKEKRLDDFYHDRTKTLGRDYTCMECRKQLNRKRDRLSFRQPNTTASILQVFMGLNQFQEVSVGI